MKVHVNDRLSPNSVFFFLSRESHWRRGRLGTRRSKLQAFSGSLRKIFGSLRTSSDIIRALRKILALSGEKCHAYKLKKVGRYTNAWELGQLYI